MLSTVILSGLVVNQTVLPADSTEKTSYPSTALTTNINREINGKFNVLFTKPGVLTTVEAGTIEYIVLNGVQVWGTNGGPEALEWTAETFNG